MPLDPVPDVEVLGNEASIAYTVDGTTYVDFASIVDIAPGKWSAKEIANTNLASKNITTQPGLPDFGECAYTIRYAGATVPLIRGWMKAKKILGFKITVNDGDPTADPVVADSVYPFTGWVKEFDPLGTLKEDEIADSKIIVRIVGIPDDPA